MAALHVQGFSVNVEGASFFVERSGEVVGAGAWDDNAQQLAWHVKPRERPGWDCDSGTLRAMEYAVLENLRPYCQACCENPRMDDDVYCWPCAASFRED